MSTRDAIERSTDPVEPDDAPPGPSSRSSAAPVICSIPSSPMDSNAESIVFIAVAMALQIAMVVGFTTFVVFRAMGRDYEAAVICSGFGGITLGSTATAVANMTAVAREYGAAPRAFLVVPLVCGFVIDLVNALVIGLLAA